MDPIIVLNNCTLAWFITEDHTNEYLNQFHLPRFGNEINNFQEWFLEEDLLFHKNWDWIMLVCEKIEKLGYIITILSDCDNTEITIEESGYHYTNHAFVADINKLRGLNKACLDFIIQYNEGTLKQPKK